MTIDSKSFIFIITLPLTLGLLFFSLHWRTPELAAHRELAGVLFTAITLLLIVVQAKEFRRTAVGFRLKHNLLKTGLALACVALSIFLAKELSFQWMRFSVLNAEPERLSRLGLHFIVGFRHQGFAEELIVRNGTGGIFITAHNIRGQDAKTVQTMIGRFQSLSDTNHGKRLVIATDQEGGHVSRMSPPLPTQPSLGELVTGSGPLESAVREYARAQGKALAALGINLNFAPVVDINHHIVNDNDRYTRIYQRAISSDPLMVEQIARWYCDSLYASGVYCTLKHFPGLGRVQTDTHLDSAELMLTPEVLEKSDWVPFKSLMRSNSPFTMLSHVKLDTIDPTQPVSTSKPVVDNLLRKDWHYDGILITDDFSMGAIYRRPGGIGAATIDALNAGVDLILISFDPDLYFPAMYALLEAERSGKIDRAMLEKSRVRLDSLMMP